MLLLTATRRNVQDQFRYSIEKAGYGIIYSSENALAVASQLSSLNIVQPYILLARARDLGSVEIPEPVGSK
jgi:hypothetical protein